LNLPIPIPGNINLNSESGPRVICYAPSQKSAGDALVASWISGFPDEVKNVTRRHRHSRPATSEFGINLSQFAAVVHQVTRQPGCGRLEMDGLGACKPKQQQRQPTTNEKG
jgi:hypothetical protein